MAMDTVFEPPVNLSATSFQALIDGLALMPNCLSIGLSIPSLSSSRGTW